MTAAHWRTDPAAATRPEIDDDLWRATFAEDPTGTTAGERPPELFRRWTTAQLLDEDRTFSWAMRGVLVNGTYGQIGGARKTLKSYVLTVLALALASGRPAFGHFKVDEPRPVLMYVGEGGRIPFTRRLERIASTMGVDLRSTPFEPSFDVDNVLSPRFQQSLARDLKELQPGLVAIDPLYAYHGAAVDARSLHEEGTLLTALSQPCINAGASLLLANHFNKTGSGTGLDRLTMAGSAEWADTWLLLSHRTDPDVSRGRFWLQLEIGSRQWGGATWHLDITLGAFNVDLGEFTGDISWALTRADSTPANSEITLRAGILDLLTDEPWQHTKTQTLDKIGGNRAEAQAVFDTLAAIPEIVGRETPGTEGKRSVRRVRYALATEPALTAGTGCPQETS